MNRRSIHAYTWVPRWTPEDGARAIDRAAAFGFGNIVIPLRDFEVIDPADIARRCEAAGIRPVTTSPLGPHNDISSTDPEISRLGLERHTEALALAADMGARRMGGILYGAFGKAARAATQANRDAAAGRLAELADAAAARDISLTLEVVNRYESNLLNTAAQAVELVKATGAANIGVHLDTFHMNIEEDSMLDALEIALPHLGYFEIDQNHRGLLSRGTIDFGPLLDHLKARGYEGLVGVEAFSSRVSHPDIAAGVSAWRPLFADGDEVAAETRDLLARHGF
jgi:D-psicose/D-tagatose/L-ribulose 3-epimerase